MALDTGTLDADAGMTRAIFEEMDRLLSPPLQEAVTKAADAAAKKSAEETLAAARAGWRKLAYAVAAGVVRHLLSNMEIYGVTSSGTITTTVNGMTADAKAVTGTANGSFTATQTGATTGHVR